MRRPSEAGRSVARLGSLASQVHKGRRGRARPASVCSTGLGEGKDTLLLSDDTGVLELLDVVDH